MATALSNLLALLALDESAYLKGLDSSKKATDSFAGNLANVGGAVVLGAVTAIGTAIVSVGTAAFDAAETVDEAFDSIAVATGAQGDELGQLQKDWEAVFTSVPTDAGSAADAISILNSRLDITGPALQNLAAPLLEVTRIMGGDLKQNAEDFTRVMGDWNLPIEDAPSYLDALFVASQQTGTGLAQLMEQVVQYGAPMRNFGFSFEESVALLAAFEAQGVNTEIVMAGLRTAQGKFITQGKDMNTGLWETVDAIQNAATRTDALAIATEIFGAKAAGDMVDTILAGKFSLDGLVDSMMNADGAIMDAADATSDWGEIWKEFQNKMTIVLAPLGEKIRESFGSGLDALIEVFNRPDVQTAITAFADFAAQTIGRIAENIPVVIDGFFQFVDFLNNNQGIVVGVLAAISAAALVWAGSMIAAAVSSLAAMWPVILVIALIGAAAYLLYEAWTTNWGGIQEITFSAIENIKVFFQSIIDFFMAIWNNPILQMAVKTALTNIQLIFGAFKAAFSGDWYAFGEILRVVWDNSWRMLGIILTNVWNSVIRPAVKNGLESIKTVFHEIDWGELGRKIVEGIAKGMTGAVGLITKAAQGIGNAALQAAKGFLNIKSPSGLFEDEIGVNMGLGIVRGWEKILNGNPFQPALASATVDVKSSAMPAISPESATSGQDTSGTQVNEEILRLLRDLPNELARQFATAVAKTQRVSR